MADPPAVESLRSEIGHFSDPPVNDMTLRHPWVLLALTLWAIAGCSASSSTNPNNASACAPGQTECGGACVDLAASNTDCGTCGNACPAGSSCSNGSCGCQNGFTECNGACVDTTTNASACGGCST